MTDGIAAEVLDRVRESVNQNDLREAIDQLIALLKGADQELFNEAIGQSARLTGLRRQERQGVLTAAEAFEAREASTSGSRLLSLLDLIPARAFHGGKALPFATASVRLTPPEQTSLERIFGANNLKSIAWLRRGMEAAAAVCRVMTPNGRGSGFLLSGGRIITNNHVLPDADVAGESRVEFNYEEDLAGKLVASTDYALKPSTFRTNPELDFTLVEIDTTSNAVPLATWGHLELCALPEPKVGDHVTIIQHPLGRDPKQLAITAEPGGQPLGASASKYTTDTQPGSSGSPVFNDSWKVIALAHHAPAGGNLVSELSRGDPNVRQRGYPGLVYSQGNCRVVVPILDSDRLSGTCINFDTSDRMANGD